MFEVLLESGVSLAWTPWGPWTPWGHGSRVCSCRAYGLLMTVDLYFPSIGSWQAKLKHLQQIASEKGHRLGKKTHVVQV